jgi:hypothetical protein
MLRGQEAHPCAIDDLVQNRRMVLGVNHNRVFCTDVLFIRTENTVGARERAMVARRDRPK